MYIYGVDYFMQYLCGHGGNIHHALWWIHYGHSMIDSLDMNFAHPHKNTQHSVVYRSNKDIIFLSYSWWRCLLVVFSDLFYNVSQAPVYCATKCPSLTNPLAVALYFCVIGYKKWAQCRLLICWEDTVLIVFCNIAWSCFLRWMTEVVFLRAA